MSHDFSGMDVAQIRNLAARMRAEAADIEATVQRLTARLGSVAWRGPDRERFMSEWEGRHAAALRRVVDGLTQAAEQANEYANRQEWASRA